MRMGYELTLEQQQKLIMTPELKLALRILQLPATELDELIEQELESNPVLEFEFLDEVRDDKTDKEQTRDYYSENEIDWKEYFQYQGKSYTFDYSNSEDNDNSYDNFMTYSYTLRDHLLFQFHLTILKEDYRNIGEYIIESIDENGYLRTDIDDIAKVLKVSLEDATKVLSIIQTFEPVGVGARDLKECLLIQLKSKNMLNKIMEAIIADHLDDIANNKIIVIARRFSLPIEEVQKLCDTIKSLEPKPGRSFESSTSTRYVIPDVYVEKINDEYIVTINDKYASRLMINQYYKSILNNEEKSSQACTYINDKLSSAIWLLKSLEHRKNTLYNVMKAVVDYQRDFFDNGVLYLKTMTLKCIADIISVHESTVSRAINGKYVQTPRGVFEIKYFFKSGVDNKTGFTISSESIKNMIKAMVEKEDSTKPISDQDIADTLAKDGIKISRRTVAKYRDELGIPSSSKRKRY